MNYSEIVSFIWGVADLIRDSFKRGKYQDVILPLTVLRRLDQVLAPTKAEVLETRAKLKDRLENLDPQLRKASGYAFYNTSLYDFEKLLGDAPSLAANLRNYIAGFSENMREVIDKFGFDYTITKLDEAGLLFKVMERFRQVDLHPDRVSNAMMGTIFEELIRKFNEALNENPGEHFTPRDVVHLMVDLLLAGDEDQIRREGVVVTIADPCCGTGGMLTIAKAHIQGTPTRPGINPEAGIHLFGQEVNPETFAVCKSDLFIKSRDGRDAENILFGSVLSNDRHAERRFDYQIANPPYGKDWKRDEAEVRDEETKSDGGRFEAGTPRISDGQLLFLQHMLAHMKSPEEGGSRIAIIMNGSPLFTGDAGSGESEIRRWILENDWLEALVALPEQLFYNTGIATYVWVLTNRKAEERKGKVQLIDATSFWTPMPKSLGAKRREIPEEKAREILEIHGAFQDDEKRIVTKRGEKGEATVSRIYATTHFGYRTIRVERPLRLNFEASEKRIARLDEERAFQNLAKSKRKDKAKKAAEESEGERQQEAIRAILRAMPSDRSTDRKAFEKVMGAAFKRGEEQASSSPIKLSTPLKKAILSALSERDPDAPPCRDSKGNPEPDTDLRDYENVPLSETVEAYFEREVKPSVPDAWIDEVYRDTKDGGVGRVGYEINFNRYFYEYVPPRALEEIEDDIRAIEKDIVKMLAEVTGSKPEDVAL